MVDRRELANMRVYILLQLLPELNGNNLFYYQHGGTYGCMKYHDLENYEKNPWCRGTRESLFVFCLRRFSDRKKQSFEDPYLVLPIDN